MYKEVTGGAWINKDKKQAIQYILYKLRNWWRDKYYAICKKGFFGGWKEISTYSYTEKGRERMMEAVEQLKKQGHLVL